MIRLYVLCAFLAGIAGCSSSGPPPLTTPTGEHKRPINRIGVDDALEIEQADDVTQLRKINRGK